MKIKLLVTGLALAMCVQAQAQSYNNKHVDNSLNGYYGALGFGLANAGDHSDTKLSYQLGLGQLQPATYNDFHYNWGWEADYQHYGNDIYGLNGDGILAYEIAPQYSLYGKGGLAMLHADSTKLGFQAGAGIGYMTNIAAPKVRTTFEILHTFGIAGGITNYMLGAQIFITS